EEIAALGVKSAAIVMDLLNPADCERTVEETVKAFGRLDVLVSNASTNVDWHPVELERVTDEQVMERVMGKGLAAVRMSRASLKHLRQQGGGAIVLIGGSSVRYVNAAGRYAPGLGNAFVSQFAKRLSVEVAGEHITVNVVHPDGTKTDRYPGRVASLADRLG